MRLNHDEMEGEKPASPPKKRKTNTSPVFDDENHEFSVEAPHASSEDFVHPESPQHMVDLVRIHH
jgi:hypothetical protein